MGGVWVFYMQDTLEWCENKWIITNHYRVCILRQLNTQQTISNDGHIKIKSLTFDTYWPEISWNTVGIDPALPVTSKITKHDQTLVSLHELEKTLNLNWCLDLTLRRPRRYCSVFTTEISFPQSCTATSVGLWEGANCCGTFAEGQDVNVMNDGDDDDDDDDGGGVWCIVYCMVYGVW